MESLRLFERYSLECENSSEQDREVHRRLKEGSGQARALMEELLDLVCAHEGIVP